MHVELYFMYVHVAVVFFTLVFLLGKHWLIYISSTFLGFLLLKKEENDKETKLQRGSFQLSKGKSSQ